MKQRLSLMIVIVAVIALLPITAQARLTILPPKDMLETADAIVIGEVINLVPSNETKDGKVARIKVDKVLKGHLTQSIITIHESRYFGDSAWLQRIPSEGTEIFLLLRKHENEFGFASDSNNIAIIKDGVVAEMVPGVNTNEYPYAEVYNDYYQKHINAAHEPTTDILNRAIIIVLLAAVLVLIFNKRRKSLLLRR